MEDTQALREARGWLLIGGCISIVAGMVAIAYALIATLVSVVFLAALLIFAGILEGVYAVRHRERGHLILYMLEALLAIVIGLLLAWSPVAGAIVLTTFVAMYFVISGVFRTIASLALRPPHWGWLLVSGLLNLGLGIIVWMGWPLTGLWFLGMLIGINLLFSGWARVMLALALRGRPLQPVAA